MTLICWCLILIALALAALLTHSSVLLFLLVLILAAPLLLLIPDLALRKKVRASLEAPATAGKGERARVCFRIQNSSLLPLFRVQCVISAENLLTGETAKTRFTAGLLPKGSYSRELELCGKFCGRTLIRAEQVKLCDCFGIFGLCCPVEEHIALNIMPAEYRPEVRVSPDANCPDDSQVYDPVKQGYDLTETLQLREYAAGDSIRQIHWKLSQKLDRLIVKDPSLPVNYSVVLFWERTGASHLQKTDAEAEVLVSLAASLLEAGNQLSLGWNHENGVILTELRDVEELVGLLPRVLSATPVKGNVSGAELLLRDAGEAVYSHVVYVTGALSPMIRELTRLGRVTVLLSEAEGSMDEAEVLPFTAETYRRELLEIEI